jgi:hydroxypyruvate reductase
MTFSLQHFEREASVDRIISAALHAADPDRAVRRYVERVGDQLIIAGQVYELANFQRVWVVGAGKAGASMARAVADILGDRLDGGVVIVKDGYGQPCEGFKPSQGLRIVEAGHPLPDERGLRATRAVIELLQASQPGDLVVCLISGGASALLTAPVTGVSLADLQELTRLLLACGANINEINTLRKHLEQAKGGQLARLVYPARMASLILSDVVGSPLDVIGSGPSVPDSSTFADAYAVLECYGLLDQAPPSIVDYLQLGCKGGIPETPKPDDKLFSQVQNVIVGSNQQAAEAARGQALAEGFNAMLLTTYLQGEARQAGRWLAAVTRQIVSTGQPVPPPACLVVGGETTVTLVGDGLGGRNQEIALGAVEDLANLSGVLLATLATDGGDGPTDAAGAVVTGETLQRARQLGLAPGDYLSRNDAYHFFQALGDLFVTGPTGTNVNDLAFLFVI